MDISWKCFISAYCIEYLTAELQENSRAFRFGNKYLSYIIGKIKFIFSIFFITIFHEKQNFNILYKFKF